MSAVVTVHSLRVAIRAAWVKGGAGGVLRLPPLAAPLPLATHAAADHPQNQMPVEQEPQESP